MNTETEVLIREALASIGNAVGQGAEYVWPLAVKQVYVDGILALLWTLAGLGTLIFLSPKLIRWTQSTWSDTSWNNEGSQVISALSALFSVAGGILVVLANAGNVARYLINPEYYALLKALDLVKSVTP